jgi:hypothetical protein
MGALWGALRGDCIKITFLLLYYLYYNRENFSLASTVEFSRLLIYYLNLFDNCSRLKDILEDFQRRLDKLLLDALFCFYYIVIVIV